jgi:hypothetical protein
MITCRLFVGATASYCTHSRHATTRIIMATLDRHIPIGLGRSCQCRHGPTFQNVSCVDAALWSVWLETTGNVQLVPHKTSQYPTEDPFNNIVIQLAVFLCCDLGCGIHWRYQGPNRPATTRLSIAKTWRGPASAEFLAVEVLRSDGFR